MADDTPKYQVARPLTADERADLEASIRRYGVQKPVLLDTDERTIIDGHHRWEIAKALGQDVPSAVIEADAHAEVREFTENDKRALARQLNATGRHLSREERRDLIAESLLSNPDLSDLQHARRTGVSDKTVASMRRQMERRSEIPNVEHRTDSKARKQVSKKPAKRAYGDEVARADGDEVANRAPSKKPSRHARGPFRDVETEQSSGGSPKPLKAAAKPSTTEQPSDGPSKKTASKRPEITRSMPTTSSVALPSAQQVPIEFLVNAIITKERIGRIEVSEFFKPKVKSAAEILSRLAR